MATNVKILLRRGLRSEISADTLSTGEMGFANDTNQLYVGIDSAIDEVVFDPFANAHAIIQSYLNLPVASNGPTEQGLEIDEDLIIKNVSNVTTLLSDMSTSGTFNVHEFGRARRNVEVLTENSFSQVYANMHLQSHTSADGRRPDLFKKELGLTTVPAGSFVVGTVYTIKTLGSDTLTTISAGSFVIGTEYTILVPGTTDFTSIGATDSNIGTVFTSTGVGADDGTATYVSATIQDHWNTTLGTTGVTYVVGTVFPGTGVGTGTGTATYTGGTFLKYAAGESTSFFIDYSLKQVGQNTATAGAFVVDTVYTILVPGTTDFTLIGAADSDVGTIFTATGPGIGLGTATYTITFIRVGSIKVINGVPQGISQAKLTDDNTEIFQDDIALGGDGDNIVDADEFSNIEFAAAIDGTYMKINYTQDADFTTEISYTVKRWTM